MCRPSYGILYFAVADSKKSPSRPNRTDIYEKMEEFLKLPNGELAKLADLQRRKN